VPPSSPTFRLAPAPSPTRRSSDLPPSPGPSLPQGERGEKRAESPLSMRERGFRGEGFNEQTGWYGGFDVVLGNPPWEHTEIKERSEEHTSELQSREKLVCRLLLGR